jgi:glutathione S-transferase
LFGRPKEDIRVVLYRDHHSWCPFCQKVWIWLEEKRVPYMVRKVSMFCYGDKERWYKQLVPTGMLPALELDGKTLLESDDILIALEEAFGQLNASMKDPHVAKLRQLERIIFSAWCRWLCYPSSVAVDRQHAAQFQEAVNVVETALASSRGPYFLEKFSVADLVFIPYMERMHAALFYYKGYSLRSEQNPRTFAWFNAIESRGTYRGTQGDFHTHAHDLPPQMGNCYENNTLIQQQNRQKVDRGPWDQLPDISYPEPADAKELALARVLKHKDSIIRVNPLDDEAIDAALRCALSYMMTGTPVKPPVGSDAGLRYIKSRIAVPRDMPIWSARCLRHALEKTAALVGNDQGRPIPTRHRRDVDPINFSCAADGTPQWRQSDALLAEKRLDCAYRKSLAASELPMSKEDESQAKKSSRGCLPSFRRKRSKPKRDGKKGRRPSEAGLAVVAALVSGGGLSSRV